MRMLIAGVSGCGKDKILDELRSSLELNKIDCLSYSTLLINEMEETLEKKVLLDNLKEFSSQFVSSAKKKVNKKLTTKEKWVLSAHVIYRQGDGYILSFNEIISLNPDFIIHVNAKPEDILKNREINPRLVWLNEKEEEIEFHQNLSEKISEEIAKYLSCPYLSIKNNQKNSKENKDKLLKLISE